MIVLLNLLSVVVLGSGAALSYFLKKVWPIAVAIIFVILLSFIRPSYMPKGEVVRSVIPEFETSQSVIQDRSLKPKPGEYYDEKREKKIKDGLEFLEKKE